MSDNEILFSQLIGKAQQGDGASYADLLVRLNSFLKNYLRKRIFDPNEIDEISQEILLAVHKSIHTYDTEKSFMSWFLAITEYKIVDYIRSLKKRSNHIDLNSISNMIAISNSDSDLKIDLEKAIDSLSPKERNVLTLIKVDGQSIADIAKKLNLTEANIKVIAHRAYLNIKIYMGYRS